MRKWLGFNILVVTTGALLFGLAIHGIDLSVNYIHIGVTYGVPLIDKSPVGIFMTPEQIYIQSLFILIFSFILTIAGVVGICRSAS